MGIFSELAFHYDVRTPVKWALGLKGLIVHQQISIVNPKRDFLAADEYRATKNVTVVQRRQEREQAEASKAEAVLTEVQLRRKARILGSKFAAYDPETALKLAQAVLDVLRADETLTFSKILELKEELSALEDELDEVKRRVEEASCQYGRVLHFQPHTV
ncbi:hypothetical protein CVT26_015165 [Gymnopilus dilepis]|uniref:Uncharacterized protein n=1 Tax=Gymnopilus dilepis TaxID=231916 RepID=A0A409X9J3_9AGAR|nr:hypothetical protein CVT26_015165 [Gymnopilus dilepis]